MLEIFIKRKTRDILLHICIGMIVVACGALTTSANEQPQVGTTQTPLTLEESLKSIWAHLAPHIERSRELGHYGLLVGGHWPGKPERWHWRSFGDHPWTHTFYKPLQTVIDEASCKGNPEALKGFHELKQVITRPFLSVGHSLLLEWRALHQGLKLGFFEEYRGGTSLPPVSLDQPKPALDGRRQKKTARNVFTGKQVIVSRQKEPSDYLLYELWSLLRDQRYMEAMRHIPKLSEFCLGIATDPNTKPGPLKFRYDHIDQRNDAG